jgi:hypothetical protein
MLTKENIMYQVRKLLPEVEELNNKLLDLYSSAIGPIGKQRVAGPILNIAIYYLESSVNILKSLETIPIPATFWEMNKKKKK